MKKIIAVAWLLLAGLVSAQTNFQTDESTGYLIISENLMILPNSFRKTGDDTFMIRTKLRTVVKGPHHNGVLELNCTKYEFSVLSVENNSYYHLPRNWTPSLPDTDLWQVFDLYCKNHSQMRRAK